MKHLVVILAAVLLAGAPGLPAEAKKFTCATFPFSRSFGIRAITYGAKLTVAGAVEAVKYSTHVPLILLDCATTTVDLLIYDLDQHVENVRDSVQFERAPVKYDGKDISPKIERWDT